MTIRIQAIEDITKLLGSREAAHAIHLAKKQDTLESIWKRKLDLEIEKITNKILDNADRTGRLNFENVNFDDFMMEHSYSVIGMGIKSAERMPAINVRLSTVPKELVPASLKSLRLWWDHYRKTGKLPQRQKIDANNLRTAYVGKLQEVWKKYGEDFRSGKTASKSEAVKKVMEGADVAVSRGEMIVETETTFYYNKARRDVYDESPDITHYLFMAIRDSATTKWCNSRHNLIYAKTDPWLDKETPPIHWRCRSEMLPLSPLNPFHLKLIENKALWRRNNVCEPLPVGWTRR